MAKVFGRGLGGSPQRVRDVPTARGGNATSGVRRGDFHSANVGITDTSDPLVPGTPPPGGGGGPQFDAPFQSYAYRKSVTVPAANVAGTGVLSNFPCLADIDGDADIQAGLAFEDGRDIRVVGTDGSTVLPYQVVGGNQWLVRGSAASHFVAGACAVFANNKVITATTVQEYRNTAQGQSRITQVDVTTGERVEEIFQSWGGTSSEGSDDHNRPSIIEIGSGANAGRFLLVEGSRHGEYRWRISPSVGTIAGLSGVTPTVVAYAGAPSNSSYAVLVRDPPQNRIWLLSRNNVAGGGQGGWIVNFFSESTSTMGNDVNLFEDAPGATSYIEAYGDNLGVHFFFRDTFATSTQEGDRAIVYLRSRNALFQDLDGNTLTRPANGFRASTLPASSVVTTDAKAAPTAFAYRMLDANLTAGGNPRVVFTRFLSDTPNIQNNTYMVAEYNGTSWDVTNTGAGGGAIGDPNTVRISGGAAFDDADKSKLYISVSTGSTTATSERKWPTQMYEYDLVGSTWTQGNNISYANSVLNHRPLCVVNHPGGTTPGRVIYSQGGYYTGNIDAAVDTGNKAGVRAYPSMGARAARVYFRADLDGNASNQFTIYYGNATASDAQNPGVVWQDELVVSHGDDTVAADYDVPEYYAQAAVTGAEMVGSPEAGRNVMPGPVKGWNVNDNYAPDTSLTLGSWAQHRVQFDGISAAMAGVAEVSIRGVFAMTDKTGGATQCNTWSNRQLTGNDNAWLFSRIDLAAGAVANLDMVGWLSDGTSISATFNTLSGPAANQPFYLAQIFDSDGGANSTMIGQLNTTEETFVKPTGGQLTLHAAASTEELAMGYYAPNGDWHFAGDMAHFRVRLGVVSKDFRDTEHNSLINSGSFVNFGAQEVPV